MQIQIRHLISICFLINCCQRVYNYPHSDNKNDPEIITVGEVLHYKDIAETSNSTLIALDEFKSNENTDTDSARNGAASDDLIFLAKKPQQFRQEGVQIQSTEAQYQIDLLTSAEEESLTSASASASTSLEHEDVEAGTDIDGVPREIELRSEENNAAQTTVKPIDMSDFVALIPADEVKSIAANYYRHDPEVQRAYAFLSSSEFAALKQNIIELPEMSSFLKYLNSSGLDLVGFMYTITNLTNKQNANALDESNDVDVKEVLLSSDATSDEKTAATTTQESLIETTTAEELNGLHGLVDSILDILPQDQILALFFDKLETNEQFSKLVDNIGSPPFAKILSNMESSVPLRNLIFSLHNNGIYVTRIVDSLKAYFFLGSF